MYIIHIFFSGPLCALAVIADNNLIITGGKDRKVIIWKCHEREKEKEQ